MTRNHKWAYTNSTPAFRGFPSKYCHPVWYGKARMVGLPDGERTL